MPHRLRSLLAEARAAARATPDATARAEHAVARRLGGPRPPPDVAAHAARVAEWLGGRPAVARTLEARLDALAAEMEDPAAQFERLTGRRLGPPRPGVVSRSPGPPPPLSP